MNEKPPEGGFGISWWLGAESKQDLGCRTQVGDTVNPDQKTFGEEMPTYTVTYSNTKLNSAQMEGIAQAITKTHNECTGANTYFAQVIFQETPSGKHFMGGKPVQDSQIFLHGQIRAGRPPDLKEKLILAMREALIKSSGLSKDQIWIYIIDLIPAQMIEYGEILPLSGKENEWFASLSSDLQAKLKAMEK